MFSIVIPLYNKELSIANTINSVLNQTFEDFEIIIVNDGSTDRSVEIVESFRDSRIKLICQSNQGVAAARNTGIKEARFEWIAFIDADDLWNKRHLEEKRIAITKYRSSEIIASRWSNNKNGQIYNNPDLVKNVKYFKFSLMDFLRENHLVWTGGVMIKKTLLLDTGMFPENCKRGEDVDTWIRCLYRSKENIFINETLTTYFRETENSAASRKINPVKNICFIHSLNEIKTNDSSLLYAIDKFLAKKIYEHLKSFNFSNKEKIYFLSQINCISLRYKVKIKLALRSILANMGVLKKLK